MLCCLFPGDVLELDVYRSWEFTSDAPVRSIVLPYVLYGPPLYLLKLLSGYMSEAGYLRSYLLLVLPRLVVVLLSIAMDVMLFGVARRLRRHADTVMLVHATSYVSLVYYTRTLSNTVEAFLFVTLLYVTVTATPATRSLSPRKDRPDLGRRSIHNSDDVKSSGDDAGSPFVVAIVLVAGFFNRPTFVLFAAVPYLNWLLLGATTTPDILLKLWLTILNAAAVATTFLIGDSLYYGTLTGAALSAFKTDSLSASLVTFVKTLVVTPLNFIVYNLEPGNLAEHGLHPRTTHLLVNMPLLFGVLALFPVVSAVRVIRDKLGRRTTSEKPPGKPASGTLLLSVIVPLLALSVFPHQEARFLIPVLAPLALLYGHHVFGVASFRAVTVAWVLFNVAGCEFFGALHQGGLLPCLRHIQGIHAREPHVTRHVIFYHTYMPPRFLLSLPSQHATGESDDAPRCGSTTVHDMKGASALALNDKVTDIVARSTCKSNEILLVSPATLDYQLCSSSTTFTSRLLQQFHLHLSTEDFPEIGDFCCGGKPSRHCSLALNCNETNLLRRIFSLTSLNLYEISHLFSHD